MQTKLLLLYVLYLGFASCIIKVDIATKNLIDEFGRTRIFHGVNAVYKVPPWHPNVAGFDPQNSLSKQDVQNLKNWGFNAVRLGMMWPGVVPSRGVVDSNYLSTMKQIVDNLGSAGIYTIVDFHQDLFNRKFCGEGAPDWAIQDGGLTLPFPMPVLLHSYQVDPQTGYPNLKDCLQYNFADYYFADKVGNSFQQLYDNTNGLQDDFAFFWNAVSSYFNSTQSVLGYEIINEPWPGDIYMHPTLLLPGMADKRNLSPLYAHINNVIRSNDDQHIIFFEKALSDVIGQNGLDSGPGGPSYNDRQVYSYHIYCAPTDREGNPRNIYECDFINEYAFVVATADMNRLGTAGFMTEFGAVPNSTISIEAIDFLTNAADKHLQSWTYWQFKLFNDITTSGGGESFYEGDKLEENKVKALSRTYAYAIQGVPVSMQFDRSTSSFQLTYKINTNITAPTEIYLNEDWYYPKGYQVSISPVASAKWSKISKNYIRVDGSGAATNEQAVTISINRL